MVDGFAPKWLALGLVVGIYLLFLVLQRLDPGRANYAQFAGAYGVIRLAVLAVLVVLIGSGALGVRAQGLPHMLVGALFLVIGSVLGKIRPNWFVGIRTPWTLASKRASVKTHRLGGWLFVGWGLLELAAGRLLSPAGLLVLLGGGGVVVAILLVYSYLMWRADPDKFLAVGTRPADVEL
ncbi:MAG: SdpI family protein [Chloroflexota bacterium]|nr:SdpI family protein [Chloroflexota bacterium]